MSAVLAPLAAALQARSLFEELTLFPESASSVSGAVDLLFLAWVLVAAFFSIGIAAALVLLSVRYRRTRSPRAVEIEGSTSLELLWSVVPLAIALGFFVWGARVYVDMRTAPEGGLRFNVTGKQWMWKLQHPTGQREINALHVPVDETIVLTMTSEDVIHSFFVPAFRVKADVVPGMYSRLWFRPTKVGRYHLFCAEYCGTEHSEMGGEVVVMERPDYERWLGGQEVAGTPEEAGAALFSKLRCDTCHAAGSTQRGPALAGLFGSERPLAGGGTALFDEAWVRESILEPRKRVSAGYEPLMPTYAGQLTEEELLQLVAYLRALEGSGAEVAR